MLKIKVNESSGVVLDWLVAKCENRVNMHFITQWEQGHRNYSTDWAQGGPIIEREKLSVGTRYTNDHIYHDADVLCWARDPIGDFLKYGLTPLIAAMRCYVASKLGDEVEVPDELIL